MGEVDLSGDSRNPGGLSGNEAQLRARIAELEQTLRSRDEFLSMTVDDIRSDHEIAGLLRVAPTSPRLGRRKSGEAIESILPRREVLASLASAPGLACRSRGGPAPPHRGSV